MSCKMRIGEGFDVHRLADGLPLILGGVALDHTKGCVAHSDGDVVVHAICDALLGALALGDIGKHFPDTDPQYKGIDSLRLLGHVVQLIEANGYEVVNIDSTIRAQEPKLRGVIDTMRERVAAAMGVEPQQVSIKATTTERLGFEGEQMGISASAVALIAQR